MILRPRQSPHVAAGAVDGRGALTKISDGCRGLVLRLLDGLLHRLLHGHGRLVLGCGGLAGVVLVLLHVRGRRGHWLLWVLLDGCAVVGAANERSAVTL